MGDWMTSPMECESCGFEWVECKCGKWIQVSPIITKDDDGGFYE